MKEIIRKVKNPIEDSIEYKLIRESFRCVNVIYDSNGRVSMMEFSSKKNSEGKFCN